MNEQLEMDIAIMNGEREIISHWLDRVESTYKIDPIKFILLKNYRMFVRKGRINLAKQFLTAAQGHFQNAYEKGYMDKPEFQDSLRRYNTLVEKVGGLH